MILVKNVFIQWFWDLILVREFRQLEFSELILSYVCWKPSRWTITAVYLTDIMFVYVIELVKKIHLIIFIIFRGDSPVSVILA